MKKSRLLLLAVAALLSFGQSAYGFDTQRPPTRHTVRLGWGDPLFETLAFHASYAGTFGNPQSLPADFVRQETFGYQYTGHIFAEYLYRWTSVVSAGAQMDVEGIFWKEGSFDRYHQPTGAAVPVRSWNLTLMPTVRFTYLDKPWVRMYSGLGAGLLVAFDNQGDSRLAPAFNLNWLGIEVGKGRWGGSAELGMLNALSDTFHIYMLSSRIFSVSVYYKW